MAKIMIIDDDKEWAENTAMLVRNAGHDVMVSHTTKGATQLLTEVKPDLIILDVMFPDNPAAGFDLAREIRRTKPIKNTPIILLTGINQHFEMDFSSADIDPDWMPVHDFMEKPVKMPVLLKKMERLLQKKS